VKLTKNQQYLLAGGVALVLIALVVAAIALGKDEPAAKVSEETTSTEEASWTVEATGTTDSLPETETPDPNAPPLQTLPSYVRYAHVLAVGGIPGNYTIDVDFFDIYTEAEAEQYADQHGLTVPGNGILYVDGEALTENIPLKSDVVIIYKSGGVESLTQSYASVEQLREWALGNTDVLEGAMTNMWEITVEQGIATKIEMVVVAD